MNLANPTDNIMLALDIAKKAHKGQVDKAGKPYVLHPLKVAESQKTEETTIVALLHDVVEDSDYTLEQLEASGFSPAVMEAVRLMTHDKNVSYEGYIKTISRNKIARAVKIADLTHNLDESRLPFPETEQEADERKARREKYLAALSFLQKQEEICLQAVK